MHQVRRQPRRLRSLATTLVCALAAFITPGDLASAPTADARHPASLGFADRYASFVAELAADPNTPPGFAVVVVHDDEVVFRHAGGTRNAATGAALTLDTPIYTASTTKSYVGLMAAQLDASGLVPVETSLRDAWPGLVLPAPLDSRRITARSLLSHSAGFEAGGLIYRSNAVGDITARDVPDHLTRFAGPSNPQFAYSNLGPFVYSMMVEARLKRDWKRVFDEQVTRPLALTRTSMRLEDFDADDVARCHARASGAWVAIPPKPTVVMNAGGGLLTSANDLGRYLMAFVTDGRSTGGRIPAAVLAKTHEQASTQDRESWGFHRTGYGLGWDLSLYGNDRFVSRSGGFPGCRSLIGFFPAHRLGIGVLSIGDAGVNVFNAALVKQAFDDWTGAAHAQAMARTRIGEYAATAAAETRRIDALSAARARRSATSRVPDAAPEYVGTYRSERLGEIVVGLTAEGLEARAGVLRARLVPRHRDEFYVHEASDPAPEEEIVFRFRRSGTGAVDALLWEHRVFQRGSASSPRRQKAEKSAGNS